MEETRHGQALRAVRGDGDALVAQAEALSGRVCVQAEAAGAEVAEKKAAAAAAGGAGGAAGAGGAGRAGGGLSSADEAACADVGVEYGEEEVVILKQADMEATSESGIRAYSTSIFFKAAAEGREEILSKIMEPKCGQFGSSLSKTLNTAMCKATARQQLKCMEMLLGWGAEPGALTGALMATDSSAGIYKSGG